MLRVLDDRVAVLPMKDPGHKGLIIIPDNVREDRRTDQGIVYARGPNAEDVRVGDHVMFSGYTGTKVTVDGIGVMYVMKESDIIAQIEDKEPDAIMTRSMVRRMMEIAVTHAAKLGKVEDVDTVLECLEGELDGYESSRGFEF